MIPTQVTKVTKEAWIVTQPRTTWGLGAFVRESLLMLMRGNAAGPVCVRTRTGRCRSHIVPTVISPNSHVFLRKQ